MKSGPGRRKFWMLALIGIGAVLLLALPSFVTSYWVFVAETMGINIILALGLNIFFGYCGQINLGSAAFYAIGAYAYVVLQEKLGVPFLLAMVGGLAFCAAMTFVLGEILLRLRELTLALGSIAVGLTVYLVATRWIALTGGGDGISMPISTVFGHALGDTFAYYLILVCVAICFLIASFLEPSKIGRAMKAIRDDETAAMAMGINVHGTMRLAFMLNGMFCGLAGILFAQQNQWLSPDVFNVWVNVTVVVMVIVGGLGSNPGAVIGAGLVTILPLLFSGFAEYSMLAFGVILFLVILFMPRGIIGVLKDIAALASRLACRRGRPTAVESEEEADGPA